MVALKQIPKSAVVEFSPITPRLMALGGVGMEHTLDLCDVDISSNSMNFKIIKSIECEMPFRCIAWTAFNRDREMYSKGIIAGGMDEGIINLWDPDRMISGKEEACLIQRMQPHTNRVTCIEFNSVRKHLFASGSVDGDVHIIDMNNPEKPTVHGPSCGTQGVDKKPEIFCLGWNKVVSHVIATANSGGSTVILDLKQKKAATSFRDPSNRYRPSSLAWLPNLATQLIVAYDDDRNPAMQLWDLRNASYPLREISGHSKGILTTKFSTIDTNLLLSCGKDGRTICWAFTNNGPQVFSETFTDQPQFDLKWSPFYPGVYAAASLSERVALYNVQNNHTAASYVPKWMKKECGVNFGFGGKLMSFSSSTNKIDYHIVTTDDSLVMRADRFDQVLTEGDFGGFCGSKISNATDNHEKLTWSIMRSLLQADRASLVQDLGFDTSVMYGNLEGYLGRAPGSFLHDETGLPNSQDSASLQSNHQIGGYDLPDMDPEQFFQELSEKSEKEQKGKDSEDVKEGVEATAMNSSTPASDWNTGPENLIKRCLLIGDFENAVDVCLRCGRVGEALFLASMAGPVIWKKTQIEYIKRQKDPFLKVISCVLNGELDTLVKSSSISEWRETLVMLCTYASPASFGALCESLGLRLQNELLDLKGALVCYLCAGNFPRTVEIWSTMMAQCGIVGDGLQDLVEKMAIMKKVTGFKGKNELLTKNIVQYAEILANSGRLIGAMHYLCLIDDDGSLKCSILKDRIYHSSPTSMDSMGVAPPLLPFAVMNVQPSTTINTGVEQSHDRTHQQGVQKMNQTEHLGPGDCMDNPYGIQNRYQQPPMQPSGSNAYVGTSPNAHQIGASSRLNTPATSYVPPPSMNYPPTMQGQSPSSLYTNQRPTPPSYPHSPTPPSYANHPPTPQSYANQVPTPPSYVNQPPTHQPYGSQPPTNQPYGSQPPTNQPYGSQPPTNQPYGSQPPSYPSQPLAPPPYGSQPPASPSYSTVKAATTPQTHPPHQSASNYPTGTTSSLVHPKASLHSWPDPVPSSKSSSSTAGPLGEAMPPQMVQYVMGVLDKVITQLSHLEAYERRIDDIRRRIDDLYSRLKNAKLSASVNSKIISFCRAMEQNDYAAAQKIQVDLSAHNWDASTRNWLPALKHLLPKL